MTRPRARSRAGAARAAWLLACLLAAGTSTAAAGDPQRGKQIYVAGTSPGGESITAIVGDEEVALPASALPCAGCHGDDGLGRPEGGVLPPDVRWREMVKTYGHVHEDGRRHPAYDEASFARVMRTGIDPGGNRLERTMPLYEMSDRDMADLIAYLKRLETEVDPGVGAGRLRVGSLLPLEGPRAATGRAMAAVMSACFEEINDAGGIFGRKIELEGIPFGPTPERRLEPLREALAAGDVFALVGAYTVGTDDAVLALLRAEGVPLVGPFTLDPGDSLADAAAFYLYPGFEEQVRVLADQARSGLEKDEGLLVVAPEDDRAGRLLGAIQQQLARHGAPAATVTRYATGGFDAADVASRAAGAGAIIHLGDQNALEALLAALADESRAPRIYLLSSFAPRPLTGAPPAFDGRIVLAYPTDTSDVTAEGLADYRGLAARHALPRDHVQAQIAALAAAKLLVEGLRRSGRDLDRRRLVESLEGLYAFRTGLTPPLTYGPNRRIGARGAHLLSVDLANQTYVTVGDGWYEVR